VKRFLAGIVALGLALTGCGSHDSQRASPPELVGANALGRVLLSADDVDAIMGTGAMRPHPPVEVMADHRNLLPNLNCLGIWQVNEEGVYGKDGWIALRQQLLRSPDTDAWQYLAVQSVVNYPSTDAAREFFDRSSDRWSKCTNHNVNITLNGQPLPKWHSGELTKTDTELSIPFTRDNDGGQDLCQRVLSVENNVIIDAQACRRDGRPASEAVAIAEKIASKLPT
jgi:hypothetical protein